LVRLKKILPLIKSQIMPQKKTSFIFISMMLIGISLFYSCLKDPGKKYDVEWVVANHNERVKMLFDSLNLSYPGLEEVKMHVEKGDLVEACNELSAYYTSLEKSDWRIKTFYWTSEKGEYQGMTAAQVLEDTVINQGIKSTLKRNENGFIDWYDLGPENDKEWAWFVNRFYFLRPVIWSYVQTGDERYAHFVNEILIDWIVNNPMPEENLKNSTWRVLEVGLRMAQVWPTLFYSFQSAESFSVGNRILFLSSIIEHANYIKKNHWIHHNHSVMEMNGLATAALAWPEFKGAEKWYSHAEHHIIDDLEFLIYPDGAEIELTSTYHRVALKHFEDFSKLSKAASKDNNPQITEGLEQMWGYLAKTVRPNGKGLLNNDADLDDNKAIILEAAQLYDRKDWEYIVTNGESGILPKEGPSFIFEWAGHTITRNNWSKDAHWAFFDNGCWGWSHQHEDMLHISLHAHGRDLLVDGGRYWYKNPFNSRLEEGRIPRSWRGYFLNSASHNTILIDGNGQKPPLKDMKLESPLDDSFTVDGGNYIFSQGVHNEGYWGIEGNVEHTRSLLYLKDKYWLVIDQIDTENANQVDVLWHYHPDCTIKIDGSATVSTDVDKGNLRIVPSEGIEWSTTILKGQEAPNIQGWYSQKYNEKEPAPVAIYKLSTKAPITFAWLLLPGKGMIEEAQLKLKKLTADKYKATVNLYGKEIIEEWILDLSSGEVIGG